MSDTFVRPASRNARARRAASAVALVALIFVSAQAAAQPALSTFDEICLIKDREARAGIAQVLVNNAAGAEQPLDEALVALRRARMNCRRGWVDFARVDYEALRKAFPVDPQHMRLFSGGQAPVASLSATAPQ